MSFTIATVNVNGLRAAARKGMGDWLASTSADVITLQEVRAPEELLAGLVGEGWTIVGEASLLKGRAGVAVTLVDWDDVPRWGLIDKALGLGFGEPVETYSTSAHLRTDLGIPESAGGRIGAPTGTGSGRRPAGQGPRSGGRDSGGTTGSGSGSRPRRRRTRSGVPAGGRSEAPATGQSGSADAPSPPGDGTTPRRRRRRRRSGAQGGSGDQAGQG